MQPTQQTSALPLKKHFTLAVLGSEQAAEVHALMQKVRADLPEDQKFFLKPLSLPDLENHTQQGLILGAVDDQGAVAGAVLLTKVADYSATNEEKFAGFPKDLMKKDSAVLKIFVDQEARGNGLMSKLLSGGEALAAEHNIHDLVAKVADVNTASGHGFQNASFNKAAAGEDPVLGYAVHYWVKAVAQGLDIGAGTGPNMAHAGNNLPAFEHQ